MQVNQNVNAANFLQIGSNTGAGKNKAQSENDNTMQDFASFLKPAVERKEQMQAGAASTLGNKKPERSDAKLDADTAKTDTEKMEAKKANTGETDAGKTEEVSQDTSVNPKENDKQPKDDAGNTQQADEVSQTVQENNQTVEEGATLTKEQTEVLLEAVSELLQTVMVQFGLTAEEFVQKLEEFGMEMNELLTKEGAQTFFLNMKNAQPADLIIKEDLNLQFHDFMDVVKNAGQAVDAMCQEMEIPLETAENVLKNMDILPVLKEAEMGQRMIGADTEQSEELEETIKILADDVPDELQDDADQEPQVIIRDNREKSGQGNQQESSLGQHETAPGRQQYKFQNAEKTVFGDAPMGKEQIPVQNPVLQAFQESLTAAANTVLPEEAGTVDSKQIIQQVVEQIHVELNQNSSSMELQLYPEHLGKIQIQVISKDGVMTARIAAETEAARQAIEGGLSNLKEAMEQQNLKVDAIEVMVSTTGFGNHPEDHNTGQQAKSSKMRRNGNFLGAAEEEDQDEAAEAEKMRAVGSSVSYTA